MTETAPHEQMAAPGARVVRETTFGQLDGHTFRFAGDPDAKVWHVLFGGVTVYGAHIVRSDGMLQRHGNQHFPADRKVEILDRREIGNQRALWAD